MSALRFAIIGAGQAGLAMGRTLMRAGVSREDFVLLDSATGPGESWRRRWDSLKLFTPAEYSALPGRTLSLDPAAYPGKDDVAAYLSDYCSSFDLPARWRTRVNRVRAVQGGFNIHTADDAGRAVAEPITAKQVIVATGPFVTPSIPSFAEHLPESMGQLHSSAYVNPNALADGAVLVIGAGNSGLQIATELARAGGTERRRVGLAVGSELATLPRRPAGKDLFWWLDRLGVLGADVRRLADTALARQDVLIGASLEGARRHGVELLGRATGAGAAGITVEEGLSRPRTTLWATGFRQDFSWLPAQAHREGRAVHTGGLSPVPGLAFLGLPWMRTPASALLAGVGRDAAWLAERMRS